MALVGMASDWGRAVVYATIEQITDLHVILSDGHRFPRMGFPQSARLSQRYTILPVPDPWLVEVTQDNAERAWARSVYRQAQALVLATQKPVTDHQLIKDLVTNLVDLTQDKTQ